MSSHLETRRQFRQAIYESFLYHRDRWLDSLDVFSCNDRAPNWGIEPESLLASVVQKFYRAIALADRESDAPL